MWATASPFPELPKEAAAISRRPRSPESEEPMPLRPLAITLFATAVLAIPGCMPPSTPPAAAPTAGIDLAGMDKSVAPGDDFNAYVNGGWIKATPIPPDKPSYGIFAILADETRKR